MSQSGAYSKQLILVNTASSFIVRIANIGFFIWLQQYLLRRIPIEEYSLLPLVTATIIFFPVFTAVFTTGIKRNVMVAYSQDNELLIEQIVSTIFPVLSFIAVFLIAVALISAPKVHLFVNVSADFLPTAGLIFIILVASEALKIPFEAFSSGLFVKQQFVKNNMIVLACEVTKIGLILLLLMHEGASVVDVVIGNFCATMLQGGLITYASVKALPGQRFSLSNINFEVLKLLVNYGSWSTVLAIFGMMRKTTPLIILNQLSTPLQLTTFHLASLVPNRLEVLMNQSVNGSISPVVIDLVHKKDENLRAFVFRICKYALFGFGLVATFFSAFSSEIVEWYVGAEYFSVGLNFVLLLATYMFFYANMSLTVLVEAHGCLRQLALRDIFSTFLFLAGSYTALKINPDLGALAVSASFFVVYGPLSILTHWGLTAKLTETSLYYMFKHVFGVGVLPSILTLVLLAALKPLINDIYSFMSICCLAGLFYLTVIWSVLDRAEKLQFLQFITLLRMRFKRDA